MPSRQHSAVASTLAPLTSAEHDQQLRKAVIASLIGSTIEWYDFFLYGTAAGLVFGRLYFPNQDPLAASFAAFGTFFVGFAARPVGAAIFGHYGDRIGRKATLVVTLLTMGISTFLIAFVPTYKSIGIWGAVILTLLRALQGIGVGGEWGGAILLTMEWSRSHGERGLIASLPQIGSNLGVFLANGAVLLFSQLSGEQFVTWGWRVPFAISAVLVAIGLWIRLAVLETPVFRNLIAAKKIERAPIIEVIKKQPRQILLSALLRMAEQAPTYLFTAFVFTYAVGMLHISRSLVLAAVMVSALIGAATVPIAGLLCDRIGRRKTLMIGAGAIGLVGFLYFAMLDTTVPVLVFIAMALGYIPIAIQYGAQAPLVAESFTPRLRYSGASLGYQLASIIAGGPAPIIATALIAAYNSGYAVAIYIAVCAVVSIVAAALMPDYTGQDVSAEYDA